MGAEQRPCPTDAPECPQFKGKCSVWREEDEEGHAVLPHSATTPWAHASSCQPHQYRPSRHHLLPIAGHSYLLFGTTKPPLRLFSPPPICSCVRYQVFPSRYLLFCPYELREHGQLLAFPPAGQEGYHHLPPPEPPELPWVRPKEQRGRGNAYLVIAAEGKCKNVFPVK